MQVKILVTKKCIKDGCFGGPSKCPVALAINRNPKIKKKRIKVEVGGRYFTVWKRRKEYCRVYLLRKVSTFISRFDTDQKVKPFSFVLKF